MSHDLQASGPHQGQPVATAGAALESATAAMVLVHGRGASARDILSLVPEIERPSVAFLAPQAADHSWYPYRFIAPLAQNEPWLSSALQVISDLLAKIESEGIPSKNIMLLGFSQGACLCLEFAVRHPRRFGGIVGLSGGLIGPDADSRTDAGDLAETPVFLGCDPRDPHIPATRVQETSAVFERLGADVTERFYPGLGHAINRDEIDAIREIMDQLAD